mmetsp:Transcript_7395/g.18060  ORF Transcript_7395/g.18060 Transcript_7395/m.18060 type:complete len:225 (+) Transcript_7395:97-771(+)|eukprot:CAMPEP_0169477534 /NCGR_PEP_ID=MMETSP1042-20121227/27979_1 /TAXON_ID=464988 /ORGANISM="Hemiselmis andersenii, Strain CCMP1180" /LENGTH=224 /DNA_ID=CAMNT_0009591913 /DNA_START=26 /DNA_END=700 /DNA_ORIENTATION=-
MNRLILALLVIGVALAAPHIKKPAARRAGLGADIGVKPMIAFKTFNNLGTESELVGSKMFAAFRLLDTALNATFHPKSMAAAEWFCQHIGYEYTLSHDWHLAKVHDATEDAAINTMLASPDFTIPLWTAGKYYANGTLDWEGYADYPAFLGFPYTNWGAPPAPGGVYFKTFGGLGKMYTEPPLPPLNPYSLPPGSVVSGVLCNRCLNSLPLADNCAVIPQQILE